MTNVKPANSGRWDRTHQTARRAQSKVAWEVRIGRLVPQPCEGCGWRDAVAHHDDYAKPLEVRWLCRACHRAYHLAHPIAAEPYVPPRPNTRRAEPAAARSPNRGRAFRQFLKPRAQRLRLAGASYLEIATQLGISTSTAYQWCKDVFNPDDKEDATDALEQ